MLERDPSILEKLESYKKTPYDGLAYRVVWADRSPIQGNSGKRGRWSSPDGDFEILNTSLLADGASAEFEAFWSLFEQRPDRQALIWTLQVRLEHTIQLNLDDLEDLSVDPSSYKEREYSRTQELSDSVNYLGCDGLIAPSARHNCDNLIIYIQNLEGKCGIDEIRSVEFMWSTTEG